MAISLNTAKKAALQTYLGVWCPTAGRIRAGDVAGVARCEPRDHDTHVRAGLAWLLRAQDLGDDAGFCAMYSLAQGWMGSYPETTGYIIPTLLACARRYGDSCLCDRAVEAADWLRRCQNDDGSLPGMFAGRYTAPRVFNTGQAIFGFLAVHKKVGSERHLAAAVRAGDWLLARQDEDGAWRRNTLNDEAHAYNVRTAWALARLAARTGRGRYARSAVKAARWTCARQSERGWFEDNSFVRGGGPATLHTIAYAMRGLVELGALAGSRPVVEAGHRTAVALRRLFESRKRLSGAYGRDWSEPADWRCLVGEAQTVIAWLRLDQILGSSEFSSAAADLLESVKAAHFLNETDADFFGGLSGSLPIDGDYERYCLVNWGPKFLIDALLLAEGGSDVELVG